VAGPYRHSKPMFTCLSNSSHDVPATSQDTVNVSEMDPTIIMGLQELRV
jgi:hypothetical protein